MTRRRLLAAATVVVMLAALVVGAIASAMHAAASPQTAGNVQTAGLDVSGSIVVIGTGGLSWSDVSKNATPRLWSLLRDGATAALSVHSVHANTCPVDGWLSLSAGERAGEADTSGSSEGAGRTGPDGARPPCQDLPNNMSAGKVPHWNDYLKVAATNRFDARIGLLGDQVAAHGGCIQAVGPGAALGAARSNGIVDRYQRYDEKNLTDALATCPATLIDVGLIRDPGDVDPQDQSRPKGTRAQQVARVDARVGAVLDAAPTGADVALASLADAGLTERLRVLAISGPDFGPGTVESTSTRQPGLVQLADLTPSILEHLGVPKPQRLGGSALRFIPAESNSDEAAGDRLRSLLDYDEASHAVHGLVEPFFYGWALLQLAVYLSAAVLWKRGKRSSPRHGPPAGTRAPLSDRLLGITRRIAIVAATVPVSTFLANLLPWWRFSMPLLSVVVSVSIFAFLISALALLGPWRQRVMGPLIVVCAATVAVLAVDMMTGSRLQISSLMGLQPVVGGRFYGMGNTTFALFATATLLLCIAVGSQFNAVRQTRLAAVAVAVIGLGAVVVDAAPAWGSDAGGPPSLLPAVALLILAILKIKVTWRRLEMIAAATAGFVLLLSLLDWLRPAESRSHLGKFVQTTLDGGAWDIVARKLDQNLSLLLGNRISWLVPVGLAVIAYLLARPDSRAARPLLRSFERIPLLRPGLIAVLVMWLIGFALNDSGTAIPAVGASLALPLLVALALRTLEDQPPALPGGTRASRLQR